EDLGGAARSPHDARHADPVVLWRIREACGAAPRAAARTAPMDRDQSLHLDRIRHLRESFAEANERLVARLRSVDDERAERPPGGGGGGGRMGWPVGAVPTGSAGVIGGGLPAAQPLPAAFEPRTWETVAAGIPVRTEAPAAFEPPRTVRRQDAIAALEAAGQR